LGRAFVGFLRFLLALFIILVILGGIGAAVYFGLPYLNERYVVPVEQNTAHISELSTQQTGDVKQLKEQIADLQKQLDAVRSRADALDQTIAAQAETLAKLEQVQSKLDEATAKQRDSILVELKHQVMLTRAIETLSRGRLFLSQSNFGLAKQDVQATRDLLAELQADVPDYQAQALKAVLSRLDLALGNLPDFPVIAVDDVDIAWNLLVAGLPESAEAAAAIPTLTLPAETPAATPTQTLTPGTATATPTLTLTPEASLTPGPTPTPTP
jgi:cell division protein FtsB